jgi:REP element-mobilizing transposase RayT
VARPHRIQIPGGIYHVYTRGVDGQPVFLDRRDRERFQLLLGVVLARHGWKCLSYCQMTNHFHVVVETHLADLGAGMKHLNQCYAQSFNRRQGRKGHLFESRYGSVVVEDEPHLLTELAYVALNPVRGGLCADPLDWEWSSFRQTIRRGGRGAVATDAVLALLRGNRPAAARRLDAFVRAQLAADDTHPRRSRDGVC